MGFTLRFSQQEVQKFHMFSLRKNLGEQYTPLYFLASLGNGGLAISFFMYLQFMVPHEGYPIATFDAIWPYLSGSNPLISGLIAVAMGAILILAFRHFYLLAWNIGEYRKFKRTAAFASFKQSNAEVSTMAIPLTVAMSINVGFVLGGVFVPGLWNIVEYLFPLALLGFAAVGAYGLWIFMDYFVSHLVDGSFDCSGNNSLSQMVTVFAFAMIGVGFAASASMSHVMMSAALGALGAMFFFSIVLVLGLIQLVLGFRGMLAEGVHEEQSVSLWVIIPILTVVTIGLIRLTHGLEHHFGNEPNHANMFVLTSIAVSIQILFGMLGYFVMKRVGYFRDYIYGEARSAGAYSICCPGVAFFVLSMFFIHVGLVKNNVVEQFSPAYFVLLLPLLFVQYKTIMVTLRLDRKLLRATNKEGIGAKPAEA
jgi:hypothetical protein